MAGISTAGKFTRGKLKSSSPWGTAKWRGVSEEGPRSRGLHCRVGRSGGGMTKEDGANSGF